MSVCLETNAVLGNQVSTTAPQSPNGSSTSGGGGVGCGDVVTTSQPEPLQQYATPPPPPSATLTPVRTTVAKLSQTAPSIPKASLITVLNAPLGNVKTLCLTPAVSSNVSGQFTVVNSAAPLNVSNSTVVKPQTITLINTPVTVVKTISPGNPDSIPNNAVVPALIENRGHNVFVKNTPSEGQEVSQSHKLLTANNFPTNNVLTTAITVADQQKTANGQRGGSKVKILSNVVLPGTSQNVANLIMNKPLQQQQQQQQRYVPRQKLMGPNNVTTTTTKYLNKPPNNIMNKSNMNPMVNKSGPPQKQMYPTHKSQIKTLPPVNSYKQGIKTLPPHLHANNKAVPLQVQRTGTGLRTIPPQRAQKLPNKPNYIGKHAVQAQKMKPSHKLKGIKAPPPPIYNNYALSQSDKPQLTFNQALTAEILETLGSTNSNKSALSNAALYHHQQILPARYDNAYYSPEVKQSSVSFGNSMDMKPMDDRNKSGLDALSLICQAVLLDHNYNATLPPDSPTSRSVNNQNTPAQINGAANNMYSPGGGKRRTLSGSNPVSSTTSLSNLSVGPSINNSIGLQDDDVASDISDGSDRKHDTEGEETDTAPEAEAVNNEDQFGDYVTRCICGFLHDDGYMIECDRCKVWQHVQCVVKNKQVPDDYLCEVCDPRKHVDRHKARLVQQQWLRDRQFMTDPKLRKDAKLFKQNKEAVMMSDSDSSDGEHAAPNNNLLPAKAGRPSLVNRRKSDGQKTATLRQRREAAKEVVQRRQIKKRERKVVKRKAKTQLKANSDDDALQQQHPSHHHHQAPTEASSHLPQLRQWIENYEEAVTNHYSPELRARISAIRVNGAHADMSTQYDTTVHKCRVHTQPLTELRYLVSTVHLGPNTAVVELRGKYMLSIQHRNSGSTLNTRQHAQRPGPFLFFYRLHKDNTEVCVDTRTYGNSARFIRRSCKPNAELRHTIVKGVLHLFIVTIANVEKNIELTIKHESHDLAAIGTTQIACACGNVDECTVNRSTIKKNGENAELHKKRRGRRAASLLSPHDTCEAVKVRAPPPPPPLPPQDPIKSDLDEIKIEKVDIKTDEDDPIGKVEVKEDVDGEGGGVAAEEIEEKKVEVKIKDEDEVEEDLEESVPPAITTRRSSAAQKMIVSDKDDSRDGDLSKEELSSPPAAKSSSKTKKLSREERKLEAILRAIEQMEKADQRKQEHQAKQAHRRESEPGPGNKDDDKMEPKVKRRRRKGRARTASTHTQGDRRNRLNSTDSYLTSGDETMLSPNDNLHPRRLSMRDVHSDYKEDSLNSSDKDVGLLLALSNGDKGNKSPTREVDSNSNSAHSSPETQLSSACLLVQAAVEPMEAGFKFPKTKKGLMNEWLNKVPEPVQSASSISPSSLTPHLNASSDYDTNTGFYAPNKGLVTLAQVATFCDTTTTAQPRGSAKKRWLRQAISEDQCDSPSSRPESPPLSETVAPPKKRRLPRESLSNDITPPTTPTSLVAPPIINNTEQRPAGAQEGCVDIVYSTAGEEDSPPLENLESDSVLEERAVDMKEEFAKCSTTTSPPPPPPCESTIRTDLPTVSMLLDPRLARDHHPHHHIFNSEHLVGTVEKTLSILGFEDKRPEPITPAKRKLSITEYRQRKKLNNNDKSDDADAVGNDDNCSSDAYKSSRPRSDSTSSCTSMTSSDEEAALMEIGAPSAFNSEPTELERQREITSLRLKKAFGIRVDDDTRKPSLDVEAILNCDLPPVVKSLPPSPNFPIPGSCDVNLSTSRSTPPQNIVVAAIVDPMPQAESSLFVSTSQELPPSSVVAKTTTATIINSTNTSEDEGIDEKFNNNVSVVEQREDDDDDDDADNDEDEGEDREVDSSKQIPYYTPDEEEKIEQGPPSESHFEEIETVDYVPPFNNPIYPNDADYGASVIDEEGRYEGRNPSPPPDLTSSSNSFTGGLHKT